MPVRRRLVDIEKRRCTKPIKIATLECHVEAPKIDADAILAKSELGKWYRVKLHVGELQSAMAVPALVLSVEVDATAEFVVHKRVNLQNDAMNLGVLKTKLGPDESGGRQRAETRNALPRHDR